MGIISSLRGIILPFQHCQKSRIPSSWVLRITLKIQTRPSLSTDSSGNGSKNTSCFGQAHPSNEVSKRPLTSASCKSLTSFGVWNNTEVFKSLLISFWASNFFYRVRTHSPTCLSVCQSACLSVCLLACLSVCAQAYSSSFSLNQFRTLCAQLTNSDGKRESMYRQYIMKLLK